MPQQAWSKKRERQYEHIKEGLEDRGRNEDEAEEIAARTVNKERAQHGEAKESSRTSTDDISSGTPRWPALALGCGWPHQGPALQRGEAEERQGAVEDDQGRAREGRRPVAVQKISGSSEARPANRGSRFSRNAATPSLPSPIEV